MGIYYDISVVYKRNDGTIAQTIPDDVLAKTFWLQHTPFPGTSKRIVTPMDLVDYVTPIPGGQFYAIVSISDSLS